MTPEDRKHLQTELVNLEADHGERVVRAMQVHAQNLRDMREAFETGRPVGRFLAADEMEADEAAELAALDKVFPFTHPREWSEHELLIEPDVDV